jgi:transcriptional regulator with XRE-family HTH domain
MGNMGDVIDAQTLRTLREAKGWDQQRLALAAGVDASVISRLERGLQVDLRASVLVNLARGLDISVDALLIDPPQQAQSVLVAELSATLTDIAPLSKTHQRQIAAMLRGYLSVIPDPDAPAS